MYRRHLAFLAPRVIPLGLCFLVAAPILGMWTATANAQDGEPCLVPFAIPDKWEERQTPPWDPTDTFDLFDELGQPLADPDVYVPMDRQDRTGFDARDIGTVLALKVGQPGNRIAPSFFFATALAGDTGGNDYRQNIAMCSGAVIAIGDSLTPELGNMVGPTAQGVSDLIGMDPGAYWDPEGQRVAGSLYQVSPRLVTIPLFDPELYETGRQSGRLADLWAANGMTVFIQGINGRSVIGVIVPRVPWPPPVE